jgi:peptide/nickel transport system permease protein
MLGAWLAWNREDRMDSVLPPLFSLIGAFPYFWMAMLFLSVFGFSLGWFPTRHAYASGLEPSLSLPFILSAVQHAFLPALTMVIASVGGWMLSMRNVTVSTLGTEFVYYAQIRGLSEQQVWWRYAVRNALIPNVTGFGMALGFVLSGALLTEMVFGYPGQGYLLIQAVNGQDFPLMQGIFLSITFAVLFANFLVDILSIWLDPRMVPRD